MLIGDGLNEITKITRATHPSIIRLLSRGSSISEGGCPIPINLPTIKMNNSHQG